MLMFHFYQEEICAQVEMLIQLKDNAKKNNQKYSKETRIF